MSADHLEAMERREEMLLELGAALQQLEKEYDRIKAEVAVSPNNEEKIGQLKLVQEKILKLAALYKRLEALGEIAAQVKPKSNGGEPLGDPSSQEAEKLKHLRTTMENVFSNPELTQKMVQTHPETIVAIFRNHSGLMEELLDKYPTALEIIHSHLEGKAESDSPKSAQPADAEVKTQPKTANGGEEAAHPHAELRSMLSNIFQNPILTKKLVETNPAMIAQLFSSHVDLMHSLLHGNPEAIKIIHQGLQRIQTEGNSGNLDADTDDSSSDEDANPEVHKLVRQGIYGGDSQKLNEEEKEIVESARRNRANISEKLNALREHYFAVARTIKMALRNGKGNLPVQSIRNGHAQLMEVGDMIKTYSRQKQILDEAFINAGFDPTLLDTSATSKLDTRDNMGTDAVESHSGAEKQLLDTKGNENIEAEAAEAGEEEEEWAEEEREVDESSDSSDGATESESDLEVAPGEPSVDDQEQQRADQAPRGVDVVFHLGLQYVRSIVALGGTPTELETDEYLQRVDSPLQHNAAARHLLVQALLRTVGAGQAGGRVNDEILVDNEEDTERRRSMLRSQLEEMMLRGDGAIGFLLLLFREVRKLPIEDEMLRLPLVQKLRSLGAGEAHAYPENNNPEENEVDGADNDAAFAGSASRRIDVASDDSEDRYLTKISSSAHPGSEEASLLPQKLPITLSP